MTEKPGDVTTYPFLPGLSIGMQLIAEGVCRVSDIDPATDVSRFIETEKPTMTKEAWAHNEWLRQYLDEPETFKSNFQAGTEFLQAAADGTPPTYGDECEAFFNHLLKKAPESAEERAASFNGWQPDWSKAK